MTMPSADPLIVTFFVTSNGAPPSTIVCGPGPGMANVIVLPVQTLATASRRVPGSPLSLANVTTGSIAQVFTSWGNAALVLPALIASPLYCAVSSQLPATLGPNVHVPAATVPVQVSPPPLYDTATVLAGLGAGPPRAPRGGGAGGGGGRRSGGWGSPARRARRGGWLGGGGAGGRRGPGPPAGPVGRCRHVDRGRAGKAVRGRELQAEAARRDGN